MRAPSPAFSTYPKDILSDEACTAMSHSEFGMYMRLLCHAWLEGSIPADPIRLQRLLAVTAKTFSACWPAIAGCWEEKDGRLYQGRLEREKLKQLAFRAGQSRNGKKGGKPSHINKTPKPRVSRALPESNPKVTLPSPFPSPDNGVQQRTTEAAAAAPAPLAAIPKPAKATAWNREFAEDWDAAYGGAPLEEYFGQVRKGAQKWGWGRSRPALKFYMGQTASEFLNFPRFFAAFPSWEARMSGGQASTRAGPIRAPVGDRTVAALARFEARRAGDGEGHDSGEGVQPEAEPARGRLPPGA